MTLTEVCTMCVHSMNIDLRQRNNHSIRQGHMQTN